MELKDLAVAHLQTVAQEVQRLEAELERLKAVLTEGSKVVEAQAE